MKLYTEEQVKYFFECGRNYQNNGEITFQVAQDEMPTKAIELPSDEEIEREARDENIYNNLQFRKGAKMVINKIKGGNK